MTTMNTPTLPAAGALSGPPPAPATTTRRGAPSLMWLVLGLCLLCGAGVLLNPARWQPSLHVDSLRQTIYPYRQWQATGVRLLAGDRFEIRAAGQWQYSPRVGLHGPAGGRPAVASYPMPNAPGGALIGRIGEDGAPFYVAARMNGVSMPEGGMLFLRINDDLLGDNQGELAVTVRVIENVLTPQP